MGWYILKMLLLLPVMAGLIWGTLWLAKKAQGRLVTVQGEKRARLVETTMLAPGMRLAVIEFAGREILVGASKQGLTRLADAPAREGSEHG